MILVSLFEPDVRKRIRRRGTRASGSGPSLTGSLRGRYGSGVAPWRTFDLSAIPRQCIPSISRGLGMTRQLLISTAEAWYGLAVRGGNGYAHRGSLAAVSTCAAAFWSGPRLSIEFSDGWGAESRLGRTSTY